MEENVKLPKATVENLRVYNEMQKLAFDEEANSIRQVDLLNKATEYADQFSWFDEVFEENGKKGIKDLTGKILVPAMYDDIPETYTALRGEEEKYAYPAIMNDKYGLVKADGSGEPLCDFCYDCIKVNAPAFNFFFVFKDGKKGYMDRCGKLLIPCEMDVIYAWSNAICSFTRDGKHGILTNYWLYIEPQFDETTEDDEENLKVRKGDTWGYVDANDGHFIPENEYDEENDYVLSYGIDFIDF